MQRRQRLIRTTTLQTASAAQLPLQKPARDYILVACHFGAVATLPIIYRTPLSPKSIYPMPSSRLLLILSTLLFLSIPTFAIKFVLPAQYYPPPKCIWNSAHENTLVIVTVNVGTEPNQRTDVEIIDSSPKKNVYLAKKGVKSESRLAITTHSDGEVGVCFRNYVEGGALAS